MFDFFTMPTFHSGTSTPPLPPFARPRPFPRNHHQVVFTYGRVENMEVDFHKCTAISIVKLIERVIEHELVIDGVKDYMIIAGTSIFEFHVIASANVTTVIVTYKPWFLFWTAGIAIRAENKVKSKNRQDRRHSLVT